METNEAEVVFQVDLNDINTVSGNTEEVVDYMVEEDEDEELPINLESCLLLNNVYVESIDELKQFLVNKRRENDSRQSELKNNTNIKAVRDVTITQTGYSHPNSLIPFMAPYFKDVKGLTAPFNEDVIEKKNRKEINVSYVCTNKPWNVNERDKLLDLVQQETIQRLTKPLRDEKEALTRNKLKVDQSRSRIDELSSQIEELNCLDVRQLEVADRFDPTLDWLKISTELDTDHNAEDCELYWNNFLHPKVNTKDWTKEEDEKLEQLVKENGSHNWDKVAEELATGRLAWQCCQRYQSELNRDVKRVGPLTKAEAELVEKVIEQCRVGDFIPWHQVKYFIEGRTLPQIKHYWNKINVPKRGDIWTDDENRQLSLAVKKYGTHNWRKVAQFLPGRSNRQCRERYMMRLHFGTERKLGDWSAAEDKHLLELAPKHDFKWVKLEAHLKGRNARQIASRYELLMKHQAQGNTKNKKRTGVKLSQFVSTRTLTVKNKLFDKIRQMISRDKSGDLDRQLRIGRQKLAHKLDMHLKGTPVVERKGRPKKSNTEESLDANIIEMFARFDYKSSPKKNFYRGEMDQCVYDTTKSIFADLLLEKPFNSDTDCAKAIRLLIDKAVTSRPQSQPNDEPQPSTSSASDDTVISAAVVPPNRVTVKGLRGLLMHTDFFSQIIAKSKIPLEDLSSALKNDLTYNKLFTQFKSLFYWPALLSMVEPPERHSEETDAVPKTKNPKKPGPRSGREGKSWLKTESSRMIEIRSNQKKLIQSEMERNANTRRDLVVADDGQPLNDGSTAAPWYVTQKDRKYYQLKSLDKSSFVFTRIKPRRDVLTEIEKAEDSESETEAPNQMTEEADSVVKNGQTLPKRRGRKRKIKVEVESDEEYTTPVVEPPVKSQRMTRSRARK